jgi:hypothetical protein
MLKGRCLDLHHASHSFALFSLSIRTIALATVKVRERVVVLEKGECVP